MAATQTMDNTISLRRFYSPRYWPTWAGIGLLVMLAWSPWRVRYLVGRGLGRLSYHCARERRYITRTNIRLCFPERNPRQQEQLVKDSFISTGLGLIETVTGWFRPTHYFDGQVTFKNLEVLQQARARGRGVLLLGAHYSTLDMGTNHLSSICAFAATYRPHKNPLFDAFIRKGRRNTCSELFDRRDIRGAFRYLKRGGVLWYAPDQDYGSSHSVMAPFFGHPAATITATSRFASANQSEVVLIRQERQSDGKHYVMEFTPVPATFPSGDDVLDAALINRMLEAAIRQQPEQYMWMHKRFKTQPGGKADSPYINIRTSYAKLSPKQEQFLSETNLLYVGEDGLERFQSENGNLLVSFPGRMRRRLPLPHPARRFDRISKALRCAGLACVAPEIIMTAPQHNVTLISHAEPRGESLATLMEAGHPLPWEALGDFLGRLHQQGFYLRACRPGHLHSLDSEISLSNPHEINKLAMSLGAADRVNNLSTWLDRLPADLAGRERLYEAYSAATSLSERGPLDAAVKPILSGNL